MAQGQKIDPATVKQAGDDLDAFADQVKGRLAVIKAEVEQLSASYKGVGSNAFQQSMGNWDATGLKIRNDIIELAGTVRSAGNTHVQSDEHTVQGYRQASSGNSYSV